MIEERHAPRVETPRSSRVLSALWLTAFAAVAGCAGPPAAVERPVPRPLGAALPVYSAQEAVPAPGPVETAFPREEPVGTVTLRDALAAALLRNPELAAFSWEVRVQEARALQASLRPNPELALEVENVAGSGSFGGADQAETTLALGQLIELGGKRVKRRRVAELDATLAGWDYEVRRVAVFSEVARAFADVLAAQETLVLSQELQQLAEETLVSVRRQVRAGATSPVERTRAEVALAAQEIDRQRADAALAEARLRLAALWGSPEARFEAAQGDLHRINAPPSLPSLLARLEQSPELARWVEEIALREAVVELEEAKRVPDVTASAGVRRLEESDDTALVFGVSVPFPVFDRNQGDRVAAHRALAKARHLRRAEQVRVETGLRTSFRELSSSFAEIRALRDVAIPQAKTAHHGVREGYLRGLFRYVDVLDAQRTLFDLRTRELDALRRYHGAVAEIERLTGMPVRPPKSTDDPDTKGVTR